MQVATKFYPVDPRYNIPRSAKDLLPALDASLARLRVESVDLYQIHNPGFLSGRAIGEALAEAVKSGRCKAVGVSNYALDEMMPVYRALEKEGIPLASNQVEFSLLRQLPRTGGLLSACRDLGVGILAYSPLGMGRLTGKYSDSPSLSLSLSRSHSITHSRGGEADRQIQQGQQGTQWTFLRTRRRRKTRDAHLQNARYRCGSRRQDASPGMHPKEPRKGAIYYAKETCSLTAYTRRWLSIG